MRRCGVGGVPRSNIDKFVFEKCLDATTKEEFMQRAKECRREYEEYEGQYMEFFETVADTLFYHAPHIGFSLYNGVEALGYIDDHVFDLFIWRKIQAARKIQHAFTKAYYNPAFSLCRTRLLRELEELSKLHDA